MSPCFAKQAVQRAAFASGGLQGPVLRHLDTQERGQLQRELLPTSGPSAALPLTERFFFFFCSTHAVIR